MDPHDDAGHFQSTEMGMLGAGWKTWLSRCHLQVVERDAADELTHCSLLISPTLGAIITGQRRLNSVNNDRIHVY